MKHLLCALSLCLFPAVSSAAGSCTLPTSNVSGGMTIAGGNYTARIIVGSFGGVTTSTAAVLDFGLQYVSQAGYACFLSTNAPLGVAALPGTQSVQRLVPSANGSITLEWTTSLSALPVTYAVYLSTDPLGLQPYVIGLSGTSYLLGSLQYITPYYWQVIVTDSFGRTSPSAVYSFSVAPVQTHMIAAPNPFHPGRGTTSLMFTMDGAGSADIEIYSLPDSRRVFHTHVDRLQDGVNIYDYDGRESNGQLLQTGVFSVRLVKHGGRSSAVESFKIVSVR